MQWLPTRDWFAPAAGRRGPRRTPLPRRAALFVWPAVIAAAALPPGPASVALAQRPEVTENSIGMKLVKIPAGQFQMGSEETKEQLRGDGFKFLDYEKWTSSDESPVHPVRLTKPFLMGVHEVTLGQFLNFYNDGHEGKLECETAADKGGWGYTGEKFMRRADFVPWSWGHPNQTNSHPVVNVSWNDAVAFCEWLSQKEGKKYRLPTEAEWEYACRADTRTRFWNGNDPDDVTAVGNVADATAKEKFSWWKGAASRRDGHAFTAPVGSFRANPFGLHDMHGNAAEWCSDWYDAEYYAKSPAADPKGADAGSFRVIRGGCWHGFPVFCRSAFRYYGTPTLRSYDIGFRVVLSVK
jgi:sulfatase modifying factor 1